MANTKVRETGKIVQAKLIDRPRVQGPVRTPERRLQAMDAFIAKDESLRD